MLAAFFSIIAQSNLCYHRDMKKNNRPYAMVFVSLFLGMTALLVSFGAASAFETPGTTSFREISAACVAAAFYLAFCQFWVSPRDSGFMAKLPTLVASITPLLVGIVPWTPWVQ